MIREQGLYWSIWNSARFSWQPNIYASFRACELGHLLKLHDSSSSFIGVAWISTFIRLDPCVYFWLDFFLIHIFSCGVKIHNLIFTILFRFTVQWRWVPSHCCATIIRTHFPLHFSDSTGVWTQGLALAGQGRHCITWIIPPVDSTHLQNSFHVVRTLLCTH
jgi:hypothetical protein